MGWLKHTHWRGGWRWLRRGYSPVEEAEHVLFERFVAGLMAEHRTQETEYHARTKARMLEAFERAGRHSRDSGLRDGDLG